jgi:hypothetical protein
MCSRLYSQRENRNARLCVRSPSSHPKFTIYLTILLPISFAAAYWCVLDYCPRVEIKADFSHKAFNQHSHCVHCLYPLDTIFRQLTVRIYVLYSRRRHGMHVSVTQNMHDLMLFMFFLNVESLE